MEISEKSENRLKAIFRGWQVAGPDGLTATVAKVVKKTQGEGKAAKIGSRGWQSGEASANYIELREGCINFLRLATKV